MERPRIFDLMEPRHTEKLRAVPDMSAAHATFGEEPPPREVAINRFQRFYRFETILGYGEWIDVRRLDDPHDRPLDEMLKHVRSHVAQELYGDIIAELFEIHFQIRHAVRFDDKLAARIRNMIEALTL